MDTKLYTIEDVIEMGGDYELDCGTLVPMSPGGHEHAYLSVAVGARLFSYASEHRLGTVLGRDPGFILSRGPDTLLGPDVAFICADRMALLADAKTFPAGSPDLLVEVVGPSGSVPETIRKCTRFLEKGSRLAWIFDVRRKRVIVMTGDDTCTTLSAGDVLDGGDVLPGFRWPVDEIFVYPWEESRG